MGKFTELAKEVCNGCDLVTGEENKLTTEEVCSCEVLTISDFAVCVIEEKEVGVVTFEEFEGKYYWGGQSLSNMVSAFVQACGGEAEAREQYAKEKAKDRIRVKFEMTKTKAKQDFCKVTVL